MGRYAFDQQPDVAGWNLTRLAQALSPLMDAETANACLQSYPSLFATHYIDLMSAKLGLPARRENARLILPMLDILHKNRIDYTLFLRALCDFDPAPEATNPALRDLFIDRSAFDDWAASYRAALAENPQDIAVRAKAMRAVNPKYILRTYLAEQAIRAVRDNQDTTEIDRLMTLLQAPFDEHPGMEAYAAAPPEWAQHLELSCSS